MIIEVRFAKFAFDLDDGNVIELSSLFGFSGLAQGDLLVVVHQDDLDRTTVNRDASVLNIGTLLFGGADLRLVLENHRVCHMHVF